MQTVHREELTYDSHAPEQFVPNGDRYLVKRVEVQNLWRSKDGAELFLPDTSEEARGWYPAVIVACGNGHRLEVPDRAMLKYMGDDQPEQLIRAQATVPMFYSAGDVVLIDRMAGRSVIIRGERYVIVNQVDVLGSWPEGEVE